MAETIVWQGALDKGAWTACVTRSETDLDRGILRIRDGATKTVRHTIEVPLPRHPNRPSERTLHEWQQYVIYWVDNEGAAA